MLWRRWVERYRGLAQKEQAKQLIIGIRELTALDSNYDTTRTIAVPVSTVSAGSLTSLIACRLSITALRSDAATTAAG